jgi:hypothetical protein
MSDDGRYRMSLPVSSAIFSRFPVSGIAPLNLALDHAIAAERMLLVASAWYLTS